MQQGILSGLWVCSSEELDKILSISAFLFSAIDECPLGICMLLAGDMGDLPSPYGHAAMDIQRNKV